MKKTLLLIVAVVALPIFSCAQEKKLSTSNVIVEGNFLGKKDAAECIPGMFGQIGIGGKTFFFNSVVIAEKIHGDFSGKICTGPSLRLKNVAFGLMAGYETSHLVTGPFVAPWGTWRSNNGKWSALGIGLIGQKEKGAIVELWRCANILNNHRCETQFGLANHGQNVGPVLRFRAAKGKLHGFYVFAGPTIQFVSDGGIADESGGAVTAHHATTVWFPEPSIDNIGMHFAIGFEGE